VIHQPLDIETLAGSDGPPGFYELAQPMLMPTHVRLMVQSRTGGLLRTGESIQKVDAWDVVSPLFSGPITSQVFLDWQEQHIAAVHDDAAHSQALHQDAAVLAGALARARSLIGTGQHAEGAYEIACCIDDLAEKGSFAAIDFALGALDTAHESHMLLVSVLVATSVRPLRIKLPSRPDFLILARAACSGRSDAEALFLGL